MQCMSLYLRTTLRQYRIAQIFKSNLKIRFTEPLVDCAWTKAHLHCIKQQGFECKHPVSDTAEIIIPKSFGDKQGSYRCVSDGNRHNDIKSCRLPDMGGN